MGGKAGPTEAQLVGARGHEDIARGEARIDAIDENGRSRWVCLDAVQGARMAEPWVYKNQEQQQEEQGSIERRQISPGLYAEQRLEPDRGIIDIALGDGLFVVHRGSIEVGGKACQRERKMVASKR